MSEKAHKGRGQGESEPVAGAASPRIPRWLPVTLFAVLTLLLFRAFVFSHAMLFGADTLLGGGYAARAFYAQQLRAGTFPGWAPRILGGTPFLSALSGGDSLYPTTLLMLVMAPFRALGWKLVLHIFLAGLFMYGWMRTIGVSKASSLVTGAAYMLAPFMVSIVASGDDGKLMVTALAPLLFWVVERFYARARVGTFATLALVWALVLLTTQFQLTYFLFGAAGVYAVFRSVQLWRGTGPGAGEAPERGRRTGSLRFALFLAAALAGFAVAAVQFVPAVNYVTHYSRRTATTEKRAGEAGEAWSSSWSLHPAEVMSLVIPEFVGNDAQGGGWTDGTYWGRNGFKNNAEYGGVLVLILAAVSFAGAERRGLRWFFTGLGTLALLFALGTHTPVWHLFYAVVPGIRMFRAPANATFLWGFAAATLAGLGLDRILRAAREDDADGWRRILRVLWIEAGLLVVLALLASSGALASFWRTVVYPSISSDQIQRLQALAPYIAEGAWIAAILGLFAAGLAWALRARRLPAWGLVTALVLLVAVDEGRIDAPFIQVIDFQQWAAPGPNIQALLKREEGDPQPYRLLDLTGSQPGQSDQASMYGIDLAGGSHPNDIERYRQLIGMVGSGVPRNLLGTVQRPFDSNILRLLNVRYVLWPDAQFGPAPGNDTIVQQTQMNGKPYETLYAVPGLPRARLVDNAVVLPDSLQVPYMLSGAFHPDSEVVLSREPPTQLGGGPIQGSVTWKKRTPDELELSVTSDKPALLVVADNWYPAWHATVDGSPAPVLRAYHTLRAVPVPAGTHTVAMVFRSAIVRRSLWVSVAALLLLLAGLGWGWFQDRRSASA